MGLFVWLLDSYCVVSGQFSSSFLGTFPSSFPDYFAVPMYFFCGDCAFLEQSVWLPDGYLSDLLVVVFVCFQGGYCVFFLGSYCECFRGVHSRSIK